jgi:hypothetical protein
MNHSIIFKNAFLKSIIFFLLISAATSCENHSFDSDKRQIMAKDKIRSELKKVRNFDVTGFSEDTINNYPDTNFRKVIRYSLKIQYTDSNKNFQEKKGIVLFTPDGSAIISAQITEK